MNIEIQDLSPAEADARLREGTLIIVALRPPQERELAAIAQPSAVLDAGGPESPLAQSPALPPGSLCHHRGPSEHAADTLHISATRRGRQGCSRTVGPRWAR